VLEPLHLSPEAERLYRELLRAPGATAAQLARSAGCPIPRARAALGRLTQLRLIQRRPGRPVTFDPTPPDVAIAARVNELQADLDQARLAIPDLLHEYQRGRASTEPDGLVEVQSGPQIEHRRLVEIRSLATDELLTMGETIEAPLRRGVRSRSLYEAALLEAPGRLLRLRRLISQGEQARVAPRLPTRMVICDRRLAMLPLAPSAPGGGESVVLVNPSSLLDALIELFEDYWQRSHPVTATPAAADGLSSADLETLRLLGTGMKDEAIARQLGVSMRTARRRISALLTRLGAASRFQAGAEAARRGFV
jgi:DNA-binding CsgD family transcriptional regulator